MEKVQPPKTSGEFLALPDFEEAARRAFENRDRLGAAEILIDGRKIGVFRAQARSEILQAASSYTKLALPPTLSPLILTGHQPELSHPGVWVKNFAATGLARKVGGVALNLVVDTDTVKTAAVRLPLWNDVPLTVRLGAIAFDTHAAESPYESREILDRSLWSSFGARLKDATAAWPLEPVGVRAFPGPGSSTLSQQLTLLRRKTERDWGGGNYELPVSHFGRLQCFANFVRHIAEHRERFRDCYNTVLADYRRKYRVRSRNHPAPDLAVDELPFWRMTPSGRERATDIQAPEQLRPRALTLTIFARLMLGDYFIHGLGGGLYDRVTDEIIRRFFGIKPPAFQILTATLHLPLGALYSQNPHPPQAPLNERRLHWTPHLALQEQPAVMRHQAIVERPQHSREQRVARYHAFRALAHELRPQIEDTLQSVRAERVLSEQYRAARLILTRRDYAWILYPERILKPFLERFLDI